MTAVICMATFNGAPWLSQQLQSLREQDDPDWHLLVSDDGSSDASCDIITRFQDTDPRLELLPPRVGESTACGNFEHLLQWVADKYPDPAQAILLCDQDDVWLPHKLRLQQDCLRSAVACCSELELLDHRGEAGGLLLSAQGASVRPSLQSLLAQNSVVGCTLALRREVLDLALPFPAGLLNHDWWLGLCALVLGDLEFHREALVRYRQHDGNVIGAYRPGKQWKRLPTLLARQAAVLRSQCAASALLTERMRDLGRPVPEVLGRYAAVLRADGAYGRVQALLWGEFAAMHPPLRWLRSWSALRL
ncbi:MAG: glycosyltransferase involved in cell wall biosynthesis [Halieaceae bacterium]